MPKMETEEVGGASENTGNGATLEESAEPSTPAKTATATRPRTSPPRVDKLPPFKVLLHNDDHNTERDVVNAIVELTPLSKDLAVQRTLEAHNTGVSLLLVTHKERAELYKEQFHTKRLMVSIEAGA